MARVNFGWFSLTLSLPLVLLSLNPFPSLEILKNPLIIFNFLFYYNAEKCI